jgi:hypothetical protein
MQYAVLDKEKVAMVHCRHGKRAVMTGYRGMAGIGAQQGGERSGYNGRFTPSRCLSISPR